MLNEIAFGSVTYGVLLAQFLGFIATGFMLFSYQQNTNRRLLACQITAGIFFCIHFVLLGAISGATANLIGILRNLVFFHRKQKWASSVLWLYVFCLLFVVSGILTWRNALDLLPIFGMILGTLSVYAVNPKITRRIAIGCSCNWFFYNLFNLSVAGVLNECLGIGSIIAGMIRYDIKKKVKTEPEKT